MKIARAVALGIVVSVLAQAQQAQYPPSGSFNYPSYKGAVIGAAIGVGAAAGLAIYLVHHSHTSVTGCVVEDQHGLSLKTASGKSYELLNPPQTVKAGERLSLRGHKTKADSVAAFQVSRIAQDHGACTP